MMPSRIARCVLTDLSAMVAMVILGLVISATLHIPAAMPIIMLLAVELLSQAFPISTLNHERHKKSSRHHRHVKFEIIGFGIWAAIVTYASYLLFFGYHVISPVYVDTPSELYAQAATTALITLAFCQVLNILFTRADDHEHLGTEHLWKNQKLLRAFGVSLFLLLNAVYNPLFHAALGTENIGFVEWIAAIFCAGLYVGGRRLQRYTRLHTRHALIKLDRELHKHK